MCARWLSNAPPQKIIDSLESSRNKTGGLEMRSNDNIGVTFEAFDFENHTSSLRSFVKFAPDIPECEQTELFVKSVFSLGESGKIDAQGLLLEINKREEEYRKRPLNEYMLITSLSVKYFPRLTWTKVLDCRLQFFHVLPRRYARTEIAANARHRLFADEPTNYMWVVVPVTARTPQAAASKGIASVDLLRGIWNLYINHSTHTRISSGKPQPVNDIHIGPIHTVHMPDGSAASDMWWYQPGYITPYPLYKIDKVWDRLVTNQKRIIRHISHSPIKDIIVGSICRYTQALDEINHHNAFLQLWSLLETLTGTQKADYGQTVKRASFFYKDREYEQQVLNHLRERRNKAIHHGASYDDSETIVYQMKSYCETIILFLIFHSSKFASFEEYQQYLDLSTDPVILSQQINLRKKVLRNRRGNIKRR